MLIQFRAAQRHCGVFYIQSTTKASRRVRGGKPRGGNCYAICVFDFNGNPLRPVAAFKRDPFPRPIPLILLLGLLSLVKNARNRQSSRHKSRALIIVATLCLPYSTMKGDKVKRDSHHANGRDTAAHHLPGESKSGWIKADGNGRACIRPDEECFLPASRGAHRTQMM